MNYYSGETNLYCSFCKTNLYTYDQTVCANCYLDLKEPGMVVFVNKIHYKFPPLKNLQLCIKSFFNKASLCQKQQHSFFK